MRSACAPRMPRVDFATQGVGKTQVGAAGAQMDRLPGGHPGGSDGVSRYNAGKSPKKALKKA